MIFVPWSMNEKKRWEKERILQQQGTPVPVTRLPKRRSVLSGDEFFFLFLF